MSNIRQDIPIRALVNVNVLTILLLDNCSMTNLSFFSMTVNTIELHRRCIRQPVVLNGQRSTNLGRTAWRTCAPRDLSILYDRSHYVWGLPRPAQFRRSNWRPSFSTTIVRKHQYADKYTKVDQPENTKAYAPRSRSRPRLRSYFEH